MKKIISIFLLSSILFTSIAFAETESYTFTFTSTDQKEKIENVPKADNEQSWFFSIKSGNVSTTNILGVRPRRGTQAASSYYIFTKLKKRQVNIIIKKNLWLNKVTESHFT